MPLKTYSKKTKCLSSEAATIFDKLLEKNRSLLNDSNKNNPNYTLQVKINNTFDDLFNSTRYQSVNYTKNLSNLLTDTINNTSSFIKKNVTKIPKIIKQPIKKRTRKKILSENLKNNIKKSVKNKKSVESFKNGHQSPEFIPKKLRNKINGTPTQSEEAPPKQGGSNKEKIRPFKKLVTKKTTPIVPITPIEFFNETNPKKDDFKENITPTKAAGLKKSSKTKLRVSKPSKNDETKTMKPCSVILIDSTLERTNKSILNDSSFFNPNILNVNKTNLNKFICSTPLKNDIESPVAKFDDVTKQNTNETNENRLSQSWQPIVLIEKFDDTPINKKRKTNKINENVEFNYVTKRKRRGLTKEVEPDKIVLPTGKKYRRTLFMYKQDDKSIIENYLTDSPIKRGRKFKSCFENSIEIQNKIEKRNRYTLYNVPNKKIRQSVKIIKIHNLENVLIKNKKITTVHRKKSGYTSEGLNEKTESIFNEFTKLSLDFNEEKTSKDIVLEYCNQTEPILFDDIYSERSLQKCRKIGEGVYGEVFMVKNIENQCIVMKVIPIEGSKLVNGENQKRFDEILSEIIITKKLSDLRHLNDKDDKNGSCNKTDCFVELIKVSLVVGRYPKHLIDLWELYDEIKGSENDHPEIFEDDQLYIVLELGNGGQDLEAYYFQNTQAAYSLFLQLTLTLAIAEKCYEFEHRDLHWGNILISTTDKEHIEFFIDDKCIKVESRGIKLTIIDFTLSRIKLDTDIVIFNDLKYDPDLFLATGDYQFEIYRLMQKNLDDRWQNFDGGNNVLWLDYVLKKLLDECHYASSKSSKLHKDYVKKLKSLEKIIKNYTSVFDLFDNCDLFKTVF